MAALAAAAIREKRRKEVFTTTGISPVSTKQALLQPGSSALIAGTLWHQVQGASTNLSKANSISSEALAFKFQGPLLHLSENPALVPEGLRKVSSGLIFHNEVKFSKYLKNGTF